MFEKPTHFFDDDGTEINPDLIAKPSLCASCAKDDDPSQHHLCDLNRFDQQGEDELKCGEYEPKATD
ncbi:MAG: hypothetical protein ACYSUD_04015 [Planctomycetota bacterium]|jgi:hypothetical protein